MSDAPAKKPMSARAEKAIRLTATGIIVAPIGLTAYFTKNDTLGYVTFGIVLFAILLGPVIEKIRGTSY